jgi:16S rRNA G527 N7-methylase RsmG
LVERVGKKAAFLLTLRRELGLRYSVESCEAERLIAAEPAQSFGVAVSRAALPPPRWIELARRLVAPGGFVLAMMNDREPVPQAEGCVCLAEVPYELGAGPRRILTWQRRIAP